ncbi:MAG: DUF4276 family protein [Bacteroides sp.]|nr:DUF4276 family protein [Bacteroides sp.]
MKIAVYVEGHTELIFVCEFLRKWYDNDPSKVCIRYEYLNGVRPIKKNLEFGDKHSQRIYIIVNAGNDTTALSGAFKTASNRKSNGLDRILVLRDMYSKKYRQDKKQRGIDPIRNNKFINEAQSEINKRGFKGYVYCHFAIMEIEAWFLGMGWYFQKVDSSFTPDYLLSQLKFDLKDDPETKYYHPVKWMEKIYKHFGSNYRKHEKEVNSIMSNLDKSDFETLFRSGKCASFNSFVVNLTQ